jgi:hypothetical protein
MSQNESQGSRSEGRKERVLHTRISDQLAADIRRVAEELRVPASNLVRNVLEEAFSALETVADGVGNLIEEAMTEVERVRERAARRAGAASDDAAPAREEEERAAEPPTPGRTPRPVFADVLAWQPVVLNREVRCADCGRALASGDRAHLGLTERGAGATVLCRACLDARE